jgi:hypothetical protein
MPNPIDRAKADLDRLDADIRRLQAERDKVTGFIAMYERYAVEVPGPMTTESLPQHKKDVIGNAVEAFLRQRQGPQPLGKIYETLVKQGIEVTGPNEKKKRQNLSGIIHRDPRFKHVPERGWWFTGSNDAARGHKNEGPDARTPGPSIQ